MTISCVADENPNATAASAIIFNCISPDAGSVIAIIQMDKITAICEISIHERRLPKYLLRNGTGKKSTIGAQTNLNEYPNAAQLKNVTAVRSTPASRNHNPNEENISRRGIPADNPKNNIVITRGCSNA